MGIQKENSRYSKVALEGVRAFAATEVVGESTLHTARVGRAWLVAQSVLRAS
jgi:hypothetical protein